jgi:hypothetical protein
MGRLVYFEHNNQSLVRDVFIETGTYHGDSLFNASQQAFETLHSIEVSEENYKVSSERFQNDKNINVHFGSSPDILPKIIDPKRTTAFWLDAHFQGGNAKEQDSNRGQCPLMEELDIILSYEWEELPLIMIDDADLFTKQNFIKDRGFLLEDWPTFEEIKSVLPDQYEISIDSNNIMYANHLI